MRQWLAGLGCMLAVATPAVAQESDTRQILKLLQGMNQRLDGIEQRLDNVEQGARGRAASNEPAADATAPALPAAKSPAATSVAAASRAVPGWRIDVLPYSKEGPSTSPIMRKRVEIGPIKFSLHLQDGPNRTPVQYRGSAYLNVKQDGNYTFNIPLNFDTNFACEGSLTLDDKNIISFGPIQRPSVQSGSVELTTGTYKIEHRVGCWFGYEGKGAFLGTNSTDRSVRDITYSVRVLGPEDNEVRDFEPDELFVLEKK